jgi:transcriptional regulator with XRE-family HTH domain
MKDLAKHKIALGQVISDRRTNLGFSREKLARITAISVDGIISIEEGSKDPSLSEMIIISAVLGIPLSTLITLTEAAVAYM